MGGRRKPCGQYQKAPKVGKNPERKTKNGCASKGEVSNTQVSKGGTGATSLKKTLGLVRGKED